MENELICLKENHGLPLDMVCIDKNCSHKGLLCHKCFMTFPHHHLGSDIVSIEKFVDSCDKALDKAFESVSSAGESQIIAIREEYTSCNKIIEKCENYTLNLVRELFQKLKNTHEENYKETLSEFEGPKNNATREIDKSRAVLREYKNGLVLENQDLIYEISRLIKYVDRNPDGQLILNNILTARTDPKPKEKKLMMFKAEGKKLKLFLDKLNTWAEQIPVYDPDASKIEVSSPKIMRQSNTFENKLNGHHDSSELKEKVAKKKDIMLRTSPPKRKEEVVRKSTEMEKYDQDTPKKKVKSEKRDINSSSDSINPKPIKVKSDIDNYFKEKETHKPKLLYVARLFPDESNYDTFRYMDTHAITFKCDKDLNLRGFSQWQIAKPVGTQAYFDYQLIDGDYVDENPSATKPFKILLSGTFKIESRSKGSNKMEQLTFENPVKIKAGNFYTLKLENKTKNITFSCYRGIDGFEKRDCFTFYPSNIYSDALDVFTFTKKGQIPELLYSDISK